jgi:hypothetical protein
MMKKMVLITSIFSMNFTIASEPQKETKSNAEGLNTKKDDFKFNTPFAKKPKRAKDIPSQECLRFEEIYAICGAKDADEKLQWEFFENGPLKKYPKAMRKTLVQQKALFAVFRRTLEEERTKREELPNLNAQLKSSGNATSIDSKSDTSENAKS